ncbi:hypothetical protein C8Q79DRAFT_1032243 [Trametes meyenii]|nr:hypothetical protein C8Q79DRAFT_1032243 [Trametes meyenii]
MLDLSRNASSILSAFYFHPTTQLSSRSWAHRTVQSHLMGSVQELARAEGGWHFNAMHARPEQVSDFRIEDMAKCIRRDAPEIWSLVYGLLSSGIGEKPGGDGWSAMSEDEDDSDSEAEYWEALEEETEPLLDDETGTKDSGSTTTATVQDATHREKRAEKLEKFRASLRQIKAVVMISIFLHSEDQRCNLLQSTIGIFLHSCSAPEKLVKVLARMGISISLTSIHRAITSLSRESEQDMETLGRTLKSGVGYDNFDFKLDIAVPTIDSPEDTLYHMTSATLLRLDHGVTTEHLKCSEQLWERSELNDEASDPRPFDPHKTMLHLQSLHPESDIGSDTELTRRGRFRSWLFQRTLLKHGPLALKGLLADLPDPESIESIPVMKLHQVPLRAMDINQSKVSGNIEALDNMFTQAGIGDPSYTGTQMRPHSGAPVEDISQYVTLVHGDLGTYERVLTAQRRRRQELTPYTRLQHVVFVPGLFHFKMAAADAIWRTLVTAKPDARADETSFARIMGQLRPRESMRLVNNAKFRQQHELIQHVGAILQLDAWRVEVTRSTQGMFTSLKDWAASKPSIHDIATIADRLALEYVKGEVVDLYDLQFQPADTRDVVRENTMRMLNYLMLYEEFSYAMNAGDIGRVETLFAPWIQLFRATGKHKYGNLMLRFAHALHFVYTEELR